MVAHSRTIVVRSASVDCADAMDELEQFMAYIAARIEREGLKEPRIVLSSQRDALDITYIATITEDGYAGC